MAISYLIYGTIIDKNQDIAKIIDEYNTGFIRFYYNSTNYIDVFGIIVKQFEFDDIIYTSELSVNHNIISDFHDMLENLDENIRELLPNDLPSSFIITIDGDE